ncbi:hypothetical protein ACNFJ7_00500 [Sphingomonas sp. HT-1]|nr:MULTISPECIES: hypothetical protein [unclassified Sphingomonas]
MRLDPFPHRQSGFGPLVAAAIAVIVLGTALLFLLWRLAELAG